MSDRRAVGGPSSVRDAGETGQVIMRDLAFKLGDALCAARPVQTAIDMNGHTARIITAIFEALKPFQQKWDNVTLRNSADNTAHGNLRYISKTSLLCATYQEIGFRNSQIYVLLFHGADNIELSFRKDGDLLHMIKKANPHVSLDDLDRRILEQMQIDSSITNQELAVRVHASAPTCLRRAKRLVDEGVIEKQVAILNPEKVGHGLTAIIEITLDIQTAEFLDQFEKSIVAEEAILQCYRVSPGPDFVVVAQVTDMPAYHAMAHRVFTSHANVRNVRSFFAIYRSKFETRMALPPS